MARRWTAAETRALLMGLGAYGIEWFRQRTGPSNVYPNAPMRSVDAISKRIARVSGSRRFVQGAYTLTALSKRSGYDPEQIRRAQSALNQKWKRTSLRGSFLITDDQAEELIEWLKHDFWSAKRRLYGCVQCGEDKKAPKVWGMCRRCYDRVRHAIRRLRAMVSERDRRVLDEFVEKVRAGKGFQWRHLRELMQRLKSGSPAPK